MLSVGIQSELMAEVVVEDPVERKGDASSSKPRNILPFVETSVQGELVLATILEMFSIGISILLLLNIIPIKR